MFKSLVALNIQKKSAAGVNQRANRPLPTPFSETRDALLPCRRLRSQQSSFLARFPLLDGQWDPAWEKYKYKKQNVNPNEPEKLWSAINNWLHGVEPCKRARSSLKLINHGCNTNITYISWLLILQITFYITFFIILDIICIILIKNDVLYVIRLLFYYLYQMHSHFSNQFFFILVQFNYSSFYYVFEHIIC